MNRYFRVMSSPITLVILVIALIALIIFAQSRVPEQEYIIPGTISATCGPTLPEYTFCP